MSSNWKRKQMYIWVVGTFKHFMKVETHTCTHTRTHHKQLRKSESIELWAWHPKKQFKFKTHQCVWTTKQLRHEADKEIHTLKTRKHLWQLKHEPDTTRTFLTFSKGIRANKLSILFHANRAEATPILIHATIHNLFQRTQGSPLSSCLSVCCAVLAVPATTLNPNMNIQRWWMPFSHITSHITCQKEKHQTLKTHDHRICTVTTRPNQVIMQDLASPFEIFL